MLHNIQHCMSHVSCLLFVCLLRFQSFTVPLITRLERLHVFDYVLICTSSLLRSATLSTLTRKRDGIASRRQTRDETFESVRQSNSSPSPVAVETSRSESDSNRFVNALPVLMSRPSFAKRQSLSVHSDFSSPSKTSILAPPSSLHQELILKFATLTSKREAAAAGNGVERNPLKTRIPSAKHRHSNTVCAPSCDPPPPTRSDEVHDLLEKKETTLLVPSTNGKASSKSADKALISQQSGMVVFMLLHGALFCLAFII